MKKKLSALTALVVLFCLALCVALFSACGNNGDTNPSKDDKIAYTLTVRFEDGSPAKAITVTAAGVQKSTDENGKAEFLLKKGSYTVTVTPPDGYEIEGSYTFTATVTELTVVLKEEIAAVPDVTYSVYVVYPDSSKGKNIEVVLGGEHTETTDANGLVRFTLPEGEYEVMLTPPQGYTLSESYKVDAQSPTVTIELKKITYEFAVTVSYPDGSPASNVAVTIGSRKLTTNEQGRAQVNLSEGNYIVTVTAPENYRTEGNYLLNGNRKEIAITLIAIPKIDYSVEVKFADGTVAQGARVEFGGGAYTVGESGVVTENLVSNDYEVKVTLEGYAASTVTLTPENPSATLVLYKPLFFSDGDGSKDKPYALLATEYGRMVCAPQADVSNETAYYYYKISSAAVFSLDCTVNGTQGAMLYLYSNKAYTMNYALVSQSTSFKYMMQSDTDYYLLFMVSEGSATLSFTLTVEEQQKVPVTVTVEKQDTGEKVGGVTLSLYEYASGVTAETPSDTAVSDENGICVLYVYPGQYSIKGADYPDGYSGLNIMGIIITISGDTANLTAKILPYLELSITVYKDDLSTPLEGIAFTVRNEEGSFSRRLVTDENGRGECLCPYEMFGGLYITIENMPQGYYWPGDGFLATNPFSIVLVPLES